MKNSFLLCGSGRPRANKFSSSGSFLQWSLVWDKSEPMTGKPLHALEPKALSLRTAPRFIKYNLMRSLHEQEQYLVLFQPAILGFDSGFRWLGFGMKRPSRQDIGSGGMWLSDVGSLRRIPFSFSLVLAVEDCFCFGEKIMLDSALSVPPTPALEQFRGH